MYKSFILYDLVDPGGGEVQFSESPEGRRNGRRNSLGHDLIGTVILRPTPAVLPVGPCSVLAGSVRRGFAVLRLRRPKCDSLTSTRSAKDAPLRDNAPCMRIDRNHSTC